MLVILLKQAPIHVAPAGLERWTWPEMFGSGSMTGTVATITRVRKIGIRQAQSPENQRCCVAAGGIVLASLSARRFDSIISLIFDTMQ